jgi:hypothetical protein
LFKDGMMEMINLLLGINMLGTEYVLVYVNIDNYFKSFNNDQQGRLHICINELSEGGGDSTSHRRHNELKGRITSKTLRVEPKGKDAYSVSDYSRMWGFTNWKNSILMEMKDRRWFTILSNSDPEIRANTTYFAPLFELLKNVDFLKDTFSFFAHRDISNFNIHKAPNTKFKDEQKLACLPSSIDFIKDLWNNYDIPDEFRIHSADLFIFYEKYRKDFNINNSIRRKTFHMKLNELGLEEEGSHFRYNKEEIGDVDNEYSFTESKLTRFGKLLRADLKIDMEKTAGRLKLKYGYQINRNNIQNLLRKYLNNDSLEI